MEFTSFEEGKRYARPHWDGLYAYKVDGIYWYGGTKSGKDSQIKPSSSFWGHSDFKEVVGKPSEKTNKGATMQNTANGDLLAQALMPMIEGMIDNTMKEVDVEGTITKEVNKLMASIPTKKVELVDTKGAMKKVDLAHDQLEHLLKATSMGANRPILLTGEAGSFKSHTAQQVAELLGFDFYSLSVGEQSTQAHLLGFIDATGNYRSTAFRKAFEHGGVFLLDEIDAGNPNVLLAINTGMSNGFVDFPDEQVTIHKDFRLIATANTFGNGANAQYVGRNKLDLATSNRFYKIHWRTDWKIVELLTNHDAWFKVFMEVKRICENQLDGVLMGSRNCMYGADALRVGIPFDEVFESVITNGLGEDDKATLDKAKKFWKEPSEQGATPKAKSKARPEPIEIKIEDAVEADEPEIEDEFAF